MNEPVPEAAMHAQAMKFPPPRLTRPVTITIFSGRLIAPEMNAISDNIAVFQLI